MSSFDKFSEGATKGAVAGLTVGQAAEVVVTTTGTIAGPAGTLFGLAVSEAIIKPVSIVSGGLIGGLWKMFED